MKVARTGLSYGKLLALKDVVAEVQRCRGPGSFRRVLHPQQQGSHSW